LKLHLTPDLKQREAGHLPATEQRTALKDLLESWIKEGDAEEQRETGKYLVRVLDEDRLSHRKLFPSE
jgi:hypothetical protein